VGRDGHHRQNCKRESRGCNSRHRFAPGDLSEKQLAANNPLSKVCEIISDSYHAAQLAANHLLERGFPNYAFVGIADKVWSVRRRESFVKHITQAGFIPHVYDPPKNKYDKEWGREQKSMAEWLLNLPKPVGLMACNDDRGRDVLEACRAACPKKSP
jgi:LacI family transcriptional regulator